MFGILLSAGASFVEEISLSVGKWEAARGKETIYTLGFLTHFWGTALLLISAFLIPANFFAPGLPSGFIFTTASLPTLIPRIILDVLQAFAGAYVVIHADRSTIGFLGIITIPLLLVVDVYLSNTVSLSQMCGMSLIVASLILIFINHGIRRAGAWLVVFTSVNAVITISLFKYNITHYNSVAAEQSIVGFILILFFLVMARIQTKENPLERLAHPLFFAQSFLMGIGSVIMSFAYAFGMPSVIASAKRALNILFAMLSGNIYFHEKGLWIKVLSFILIGVGLILLV